MVTFRIFIVLDQMKILDFKLGTGLKYVKFFMPHIFNYVFELKIMSKKSNLTFLSVFPL